jgi:hypothetical protein
MRRQPIGQAVLQGTAGGGMQNRHTASRDGLANVPPSSVPTPFREYAAEVQGEPPRRGAGAGGRRIVAATRPATTQLSCSAWHRMNASACGARDCDARAATPPNPTCRGARRAPHPPLRLPGRTQPAAGHAAAARVAPRARYRSMRVRPHPHLARPPRVGRRCRANTQIRHLLPPPGPSQRRPPPRAAVTRRVEGGCCWMDCTTTQGHHL